ncbi:NAD-binding protein [Haloplanus rubicundus]|uniref:NAD-binding protein n=1 Tax=Haloplanus rubicundus TaxID=1547898 RepID=UPI0021CB602F|nr:NAD-binding protein [Haloplanus rubicundus]
MNVQIALLATQLAPDLTVIVRVGDETYESVARHAGADDVMIPEVSGGERVSEQW